LVEEREHLVDKTTPVLLWYFWACERHLGIGDSRKSLKPEESNMKRHVVVIGALFAGVVGAARGQGLFLVDDAQGSFIDISGTGTSLGLSGDEEAVIFTSVGNSAFPAGRVVIANNGGISFDPVITELEPVNQPIPSDAAFGGARAVLPFWDDVGNDIGDVFWEERDGVLLIIQWHNHRFEDSEDTSRFQIQIFGESSTDGMPGDPGPINFGQLIYDDIEQPRAGGGASATIGYQRGNALEFPDIQWSFDTPGAVSDGTVLTFFSPEPGSLALLMIGGVLLTRGHQRHRT
jgi:hypothetical protein